MDLLGALLYTLFALYLGFIFLAAIVDGALSLTGIGGVAYVYGFMLFMIIGVIAAWTTPFRTTRSNVLQVLKVVPWLFISVLFVIAYLKHALS